MIQFNKIKGYAHEFATGIYYVNGLEIWGHQDCDPSKPIVKLKVNKTGPKRDHIAVSLKLANKNISNGWATTDVAKILGHIYKVKNWDDVDRNTVDHIDRNPSNNKLENLRYLTWAENVTNMNSKCYYKVPNGFKAIFNETQSDGTILFVNKGTFPTDYLARMSALIYIVKERPCYTLTRNDRLMLRFNQLAPQMDYPFYTSMKEFEADKFYHLD